MTLNPIKYEEKNYERRKVKVSSHFPVTIERLEVLSCKFT